VVVTGSRDWSERVAQFRQSPSASASRKPIDTFAWINPLLTFDEPSASTRNCSQICSARSDSSIIWRRWPGETSVPSHFMQ